MNKTNFTPGPWRLKSGSESKIESATGRKVASADMQEKQSYDPWGQIRGRVAATPERKANAALIAAAPEMYDLLQSLLRWCEQNESTGGLQQFRVMRENIEIIEKLLKKARGEK